jgi:hypothetical protein
MTTADRIAAIDALDALIDALSSFNPIWIHSAGAAPA